MSYEEIDLDAIESNKDEAPDYRPMLKSDGPGAPSEPDTRRYTVNVLSTLETEEKSRYEEFAKVAEGEGLGKIARIFRDIMREEEGHSGELPESRTVNNLKTSIGREKEKLGILRSMISDAQKDGDTVMEEKLKAMFVQEEGHVRKLTEAVSELETRMDDVSKKKASKSEESSRVCKMGKCVEKSKFEEDFETVTSDI